MHWWLNFNLTKHTLERSYWCWRLNNQTWEVVYNYKSLPSECSIFWNELQFSVWTCSCQIHQDQDAFFFYHFNYVPNLRLLLTWISNTLDSDWLEKFLNLYVLAKNPSDQGTFFFLFDFVPNLPVCSSFMDFDWLEKFLNLHVLAKNSSDQGAFFFSCLISSLKSPCLLTWTYQLSGLLIG